MPRALMRMNAGGKPRAESSGRAPMHNLAVVQRARVAILIGPKGRGSNMRALVEACRAGLIPADVALVVSPKDGTPGVAWAREQGLPVSILPGAVEDYDEALERELSSHDATHVCLAGYLRLLPAGILGRYPRRVLNIHPALLPEHGGKGMYGAAVHEAVLAAGDAESGCTVHYVTERYDEGEIIVQLRCEVRADDTPESLAARVLELEHKAYPEALKRVVQSYEP